ncbi:MAG: AAA family ATPase [Eubacteriaceae bacterium]|nr:AAA family ATPase [Eubacteriaceae bacterium]
MIIKELHLIAFGKFHNKVITFENGLNLVSGQNEAGKSTVHKFIEGMFFGFFKPYSKNKIYTPDYEKYLPWVGDEYKGAIVYEQSGRLYRLERNFMRGHEWVKLYDHKTGEDLTWTLDFDATAKMPKANLHLNISSVMFRNTASIAQMGNPTGEELTREIGDMFVNATGTYSAGISLNKALEILKKNKDELGTKRKTKSPYGKNVKELEELKARKKEIEDEVSANKEKYIRATQIESQLEILKEQKDNLTSVRDNISSVRAINKYERYLSAKEEADSLRLEIENGPSVTSETERQFNRANDDIDRAEEALKSAEDKLNTENIRHKALTDSRDLLRGTVAGFDRTEIAADEEILTKKMEQLEKHKQRQSEETTGPEVYRKYKSLQKQEKNFTKFTLIMLVLTAVFSPLAIFVDTRFLYFAGAFMFLTATFFGLRTNAAIKRKKLQPDYERYDTLMSRTTNLMLMCEIDIDELTKKYSCKDARELMDLFISYHETSSQLAKLESDISECERQMRVLADEISEQNNIINENLDIINSIYTLAGCEDAKSFYEIVERSKNTAVAQAKYEAVLKMIDEILLGEDPQELRKKYATAKTLNIESSIDSEDELSKEMDKINEDILTLTRDSSELFAQVRRSEENMTALNEVCERIAYLEEAVSEYESEMKAYDIAISEISELSKEIRGSFSEEFNSFISLTVSDITNKKYSDVVVNESLKMMVLDKELGSLVDMNSLSGGTVDQLYFAMRFAIMDLVLTEKNIPVFLDDCFTQYDEGRLENVLRFLLKRALYKQIIIFTCRNQEADALNSMKADYNYIEM